MLLFIKDQRRCFEYIALDIRTRVGNTVLFISWSQTDASAVTKCAMRMFTRSEQLTMSPDSFRLVEWAGRSLVPHRAVVLAKIDMEC